MMLGFIVLTLGVGLLVARLPLGVVGLRFIYRVASGWLRLVDHRTDARVAGPRSTTR